MTRILPVEEWGRLADTECGSIIGHLDPQRTFPVVVEEHGEIVACHLLLWELRAECLWVRPDRRLSTVGGRLWAAVKATARALGASTLITSSMDERVTKLLAHVHAVKLPGDHYVIPI